MDNYDTPKYHTSSRICDTTLRFIALVCSLAALGVLISLQIPGSKPHTWTRYDYKEKVTGTAASLPFVIISIIWNIVEVLLRIMKGGVHPVFNICFDTICWAGMLATATLNIILYYWAGAVIGASAMQLVSTLFHLVLFVQACIATHRLRSRRSH